MAQLLARKTVPCGMKASTNLTQHPVLPGNAIWQSVTSTECDSPRRKVHCMMMTSGTWKIASM